MTDTVKSETHPDISYVMPGCKCSMCQQFGGPDNQLPTVKQAWEKAQAAWEKAGKPIPCYEPNYLAARKELAEAYRRSGVES